MALASLRFGIILMSAAGTVLQLNPAAQQIVAGEDGLSLSRGRLRAAKLSEDRLLDRLLRGVGDSGPARAANTGGSLAVSRLSGGRPLALRIIRLPGDPKNPSRGEQIVVFISDPEQRHDIPVELLARLYALTRREAALVALLIQGLDIKEAADQLGIRQITARSYLKSIFGKTGTHRQTELMRLVLTGPAGFVVS